MDFWRIFVDSMDLYAFLQYFYGFYPIDLWISMGFCFLNGLWISSGWAYVVVWVGGLRGLGYCDFLVSWRSGISFFTASFPKGGQRVLVVHRPCTETPAGPAGPWESIGVQHSNVTFSDLPPPSSGTGVGSAGVGRTKRPCTETPAGRFTWER